MYQFSTTLSNQLFSHIDSISANENVDVVEELSYDAWGNRRFHANWAQPDNRTSFITNRGFTGHEHLDVFGLINANARMYEPATGRFLTADPYVQAPDYSQNYNRYSYCLNNPLVYTDPSGEIIFTIIGTLLAPVTGGLSLSIGIGADIGWMTGGMRSSMQGETFWYGAWRGALTGAVGGLLAPIGGGTFVANIAWGMGQGAITGGLDAALWGNDVGNGMLWGAALGGAFAATTSSIEAYGNYKEGYGFGTDVGIFNKYVNDVQNAYLNKDFSSFSSSMGKLNEFASKRFGLSANFQFHPYESMADNYGNASVGFFDHNNNTLVKRSGGAIRRSMSHENDHIRNITITYDGKGKSSEISRSLYKGDNLFVNSSNHGTNGYYAPIRDSGKLHLGKNIVESSRPGTQIAWQQFGWKKWYYLIPRRF